MRVDDIKIALECSDDAHQSVVQALEDGRMVVFKGNILFVEQEDGTLEQFRLVSYFAFQELGMGVGGAKHYYVEVKR